MGRIGCETQYSFPREKGLFIARFWCFLETVGSIAMAFGSISQIRLAILETVARNTENQKQ